MLQKCFGWNDLPPVFIEICRFLTFSTFRCVQRALLVESSLALEWRQPCQRRHNVASVVSNALSCAVYGRHRCLSAVSWSASQTASLIAAARSSTDRSQDHLYQTTIIHYAVDRILVIFFIRKWLKIEFNCSQYYSNDKVSAYLTIFRTTSCYRLYTVLYFAF